MNRYVDLIQRTETFFQSVCQLIGRSGQCHQRGTDYQIDKSYCHLHCKGNALSGNLEDSKFPQYFSWCKKNIKYHGDHQNHKDRFQPFENKFYRDFGRNNNTCQKQCCHCISQYRTEQEYGNDKEQCSCKFGSGIQLMNHRSDRIILSDGNISNHPLEPPFSKGEFFSFRAFRISSLASSTVMSPGSTFSPLAFSECMI